MKNKLFDIIEELNPKYIDILEDVCNIESPTSLKENVDLCAQYFVNLAKERSWDVEIREVEGAGNPVCITMNPNAKKEPVVFSGHLDTVHPVGLFGYPPVRREGEKMYGPGLVDCKGGVVAAFFAMDALRLAGFTDRPIKLILQTDEETSSKNSNKKTIEFMVEKSQGAIAFINNEGNADRNSVVLYRKGIHRFRFHIKGKAAHSSKCPSGANAIAEAAHKILELEKWKDIESITCNCGVIEGGTVANSVAETCSFYADFRYLTEEDHKTILAEVKRVGETNYIPGCTCTVEEISSRPGMPITDKNMALFNRVNEIFKENGMNEVTYKKSYGGSDAAYITQAGIPCIDNIGTVGGRIHSPEEYTYLDSLALATQRLALIALNI